MTWHLPSELAKSRRSSPDYNFIAQHGNLN
jgi:hypothetical protein